MGTGTVNYNCRGVNDKKLKSLGYLNCGHVWVDFSAKFFSYKRRTATERNSHFGSFPYRIPADGEYNSNSDSGIKLVK